MTSPHESVAFTRWAAIVTTVLYTAGYAAVGFGLLFFGSLWRLMTRRSFYWHPSALDLPLTAFGLVLIASAAVSPYKPLAFGVTLMLIISGAVYFGSFAWLLQHAPAARTALLQAWALGAAPTALAGLASAAVTHARAAIPRGVGPNGLGTTLALGSILALGLTFRARGWARAVWFVCGFVSLVGIVGAESRAALLGWAVGASYLAWRELRARPKHLAAALAGALVLLLTIGALTPSIVKRVRATASDVSHNRLLIWRSSLGMIKAHPLLGTGFGTFETAYAQVKAPEMSSEPFAFNLALNIAAETGLLGLLGALWVVVTAVRLWRHEDRRAAPDADAMRPIVAALWIGLLVDQLADNTLFSISTSAGLWLLLALLVVPGSAPRGERP